MGKAANVAISVEELFRDLDMGVAIIDAALRVVMVNPYLAGVNGVPFEAHAGARVRDVVPPECVSVIEAGAQRAIATGEPVRDLEVTIEAPGKPGARTRWSTTFMPIRRAGVVVGVGAVIVERTEQWHTEIALRESEARFRRLAENLDCVFWLADEERIHYISPGFETIWGRPIGELGADRWSFLQAVHEADRHLVRDLVRSPDGTEIEYRIARPDGSLRWIHARVFPVKDGAFGDGLPLKAGISRDVTKAKALEARVLEAQKLDSIGRLAGGIAHDFNNVLTVVLNQARMAARVADRGVSPREHLAQIEDAASRAAELTRQLLTFARRQVTHPMPLDLNEVTRGIEGMLRRLIGTDIEIVTRLTPDLDIVRVDRTQLEQVIVNLLVNARDAMPDGGLITIETANVDLGGVEALRAGVTSGRYVVLRVSDNGRGIAPEDKAHLFEPFFTTKKPGEGTGLGLATSWGIVKQHGGFIDVDSELGHGSSFSAFFPGVKGMLEPQARHDEPPAVVGGSGTVLVVEDDAAVRKVAVRVLREHGFQVLVASDGIEALELLRVESARVDVVFTDASMPRMGGRELASRLRQQRPALPVVLTSGYLTGPGDDGVPFLEKPYLASALVETIRTAIDARGKPVT
jgi:PAS domain S-box-containing protein